MGFNDEFRNRTKKFSLRIIKLFRTLPKDEVSKYIGKQLLRSSMSAASNFRSATNARSKAEFIAKLGVALEEADESTLWLELLVDAEVVKFDKLSLLIDESEQLVKILSKSRKTFYNNKRKTESKVNSN